MGGRNAPKAVIDMAAIAPQFWDDRGCGAGHRNPLL